MNISDVLLVLMVYTLILCHKRIEGTKWKLSQEDLDFERRLKLLNKPAVKTIHTLDGDKYDCVDFYKQLSFDHPLLQNHTYDLDQMMAKGVSYNKRDDMFSNINVVDISLKGGKCPARTVPIRKITKDDLIRERRASKFRSLVAGENPDAHYAVVRTKDSGMRYAGASGHVSLYRPEVGGPQYSAARLVLKNGPDSIEVGWRVDRVLYGDGECTMYARTTINNSSFFNLRRPGSVMTSDKIPLDARFTPISQRGVKIYQMKFNIDRDGSGNWVLSVTEKDQQVGFWPNNIFSSGGLRQFATYIDWGGEVFSPKYNTKPPMGSSYFPVRDTKKDCTFFQLTFKDDKGVNYNAYDLETFADSPNYKIIDEGDVGYYFHSMVVFGCPGGQRNNVAETNIKNLYSNKETIKTIVIFNVIKDFQIVAFNLSQPLCVYLTFSLMHHFIGMCSEPVQVFKTQMTFDLTENQ